jgi:CheY-like chemotaxis protein
MPAIIVVNDRPEILDILAELLRLWAHSNVVTFLDPHAALEHAQELERAPVIIAEYGMPGL